MTKIAINGFGRIGRLAFRLLIEDPSLEVVAFNDLTDAKTLAHLLKYDTAHGRFNGTVEVSGKDLIVNKKLIKVFAEKNPENLPWGNLGIDLVIESTGFFVSEEASKAHLKAGAKKVVISAPAKGELPTIVYNVNHKILSSKDKIISAASCTTNCLAPIAQVLDKEFGLEGGMMNTIHAYTGDQKLQDAPHSDLRRARAGAQNIVPTSTGAAVAVGKVLPELQGKLDGFAMRVPTLTGSVVDLTFSVKKNGITVKDINNAMKSASNESLGYTLDPIVSSDVIGITYGTLFDSLMTKQLDGQNMFKIVTWYDNEFSYVHQLIRTIKYFVKL
ncbi:MAG: type I glyceraldehyde-3-phosphate dehydrogenase [Mycoplasmataceae bacterium]|nr:type I glyceraldehyde-3-phosphate dehydrogenase [Mycoplasmataceae bacterium]